MVSMNPPWFDQDNTQKAEGTRGDGRTEGHLKLGDWLDYGIKKLKPQGMLAIIHRAYRLDDIIYNIHGRLGNVKVIPVYSYADQPAKNVIVLGQKGRKTPMEICSGFITYQENGSYTPLIHNIQQGNWQR